MIIANLHLTSDPVLRHMTKAMRRSLVGSTLLVLVLSGCSSGPPLPEHTVDREALYENNAQVFVQVTTDISQTECEALIDEYRSIAGPNGQVAVRKPSPELKGQVVPWCVDNQDGAGVFLNDALF